MPLPLEPALSELVARKEEEWRALQAQQSQLKEAALQDAQERLREAQSELCHLREDFVYNLELLEERDHELDRYDTAFAQARQLEGARQVELSELKIQVAKLRQALTRETQKVEDLQQQQQRTWKEHRLQLDRLHSDRNGEIDQQREQYARLKWKLEKKLQELDSELALQKQELMIDFESELQRREHEFRLKADSMSQIVLANELKVRVLSQELDTLKAAGLRATESLRDVEAERVELQDELQRKEWAIQDVTAVKDARIKDLEDQLHTVQLSRKKEEEAFQRKHEELDRVAREKDAALVSVKDAHMEQLRGLEARIRELEAQCQMLERQLRRAEWKWEDMVQEKDALIDKLREEAATLKLSLDTQMAQLTKEAVAKDLQLQALQEQEAKFKAQLAGSQRDVDRYRQQLAQSMCREQNLQREKVQVELDWQRRCDDVETELHRRTENLVQELTSAREQVAARLQEAERLLCEREAVVKAVSLERDKAVEALKIQNCTSFLEKEDTQEDAADSGFPSSEILRLQQHNTNLRCAITQMRKEMEALSCHVGTQAPSTTQTTTCPPDSVLGLETEIQSLKHKFKSLEEQLKDMLDASKTSLTCVPAKDCAGALPAGGAMGLALRSLGDRTQLLSFLVAQLRQKVMQKPLDLDTIRCELPCQVDQVQLEVRELQGQVAELEKHLETSSKGNHSILCGQQQEVSAPVCIQGPSSEEVPGVPCRQQQEDPSEEQAQPPSGMLRLQQRLKEAARRIQRLRLEKEQLLELGNKLRAQRGSPAGTPCHPICLSPGNPNPGETGPAPLDCGPAKDRANCATQQSWKKAKKDPAYSLGPQRPHWTHTLGLDGAAVTQEENCIPTVGPQRCAPEKESGTPVLPEKGHSSQQPCSLASSPLQDVWNILDLGSSPSDFASQHDSAPEPGPAAPTATPLHLRQVAFSLQGVKIDPQAKARPTGPARPAQRPPSCLRPPKAPKIRNYNFKD